jgi:hypothetical protein
LWQFLVTARNFKISHSVYWKHTVECVVVAGINRGLPIPDTHSCANICLCTPPPKKRARIV